jgi:LytR cell envelope-related transcriptional attenuator
MARSAQAATEGVTASRAVAEERTAAAAPARAGARGTGSARRGAGAQPAVRRYRAERSSPARATLLIVGAVLVGVAVLVVVLLSVGGGSGSSNSPGAGAKRTAGLGKAAGKHHSGSSRTSSSKSASAGAKASETNVVVLNGTSTTGLAHRVSGELRQSGFSRATALDGRPPGANQVTTVEYSSGHSSEAQGVARAIGVSQAQPMEGTVASLAGSATVVVIVGLDKAATVP